MTFFRKLLDRKSYVNGYRPLLMVMLLSVFSVFLWMGVVYQTGKLNYLYLLWNLFLAWLPLFFSYLLYHRLHFPTDRLKMWKFWGMTLLWLLFFPNAPYIITDLVHINERHHPASWFDALLLFSFAISGLAVGINSLFIMQINVEKRLGRKLSYLVIGASIFLSGFGVFLGRVQRWNSWDIITRPHELFRDIIVHLNNPTAAYMTFGFSLLTGMLYLLTLSIMKPQK